MDEFLNAIMVCLSSKCDQNIPTAKVLITEWPLAKTGCPPSDSRTGLVGINCSALQFKFHLATCAVEYSNSVYGFMYFKFHSFLYFKFRLWGYWIFQILYMVLVISNSIVGLVHFKVSCISNPSCMFAHQPSGQVCISPVWLKWLCIVHEIHL